MARFNIAVVGHVSNGKTQLVQALTNTDTKRTSEEKKRGRTIKLGYANGCIWKCPVCNAVQMQEFGTKECFCIFCPFEPMVNTFFVSFVDAPGHHAYVHTMTRGAVVVDYAILVTDVRSERLQIQSIEHLAILSLLGVRYVIVVQNKADLVSIETCRAHYIMLREALRGTIAETSPILPVSAVTGLNLDVLCKCLYRLLAQDGHNVCGSSQHQVFNIIRTFDINFNGTEVEDIRGGVLGGTFRGTRGLSVGQDITILPGLVSADKTFKPVQTRIRSIHLERQTFDQLSYGGLFGVGTSLDPSLTKSDKLVGCVAVSSTEPCVPPVHLDLVLSTRSLNIYADQQTQAVREHHLYFLIIGSLMVRAETTEKLNKRTFRFKLNQPICTIENKCLIYSCESSNSRLIAIGYINDCSVPQPTTFIFTTEYENVLIGWNAPPPSILVKLPVPKLVREKRNRIWTNIDQICGLIDRTQDDVVSYLMTELQITTSVCSQGLRMFKCNYYSDEQCIMVIKRYIKTYVRCRQCNSLQTTPQVCKTCHATMRLDIANE
jgi:translation initiation factor 2 subunit 3